MGAGKIKGINSTPGRRGLDGYFSMKENKFARFIRFAENA
jgi:hypothetical protein